MTEGPYTIAEVAEILRISYASARRRFRKSNPWVFAYTLKRIA